MSNFFERGVKNKREVLSKWIVRTLWIKIVFPMPRQQTVLSSQALPKLAKSWKASEPPECTETVWDVQTPVDDRPRTYLEGTDPWTHRIHGGPQLGNESGRCVWRVGVWARGWVGNLALFSGISGQPGVCGGITHGTNHIKMLHMRSNKRHSYNISANVWVWGVQHSKRYWLASSAWHG